MSLLHVENLGTILQVFRDIFLRDRPKDGFFSKGLSTFHYFLYMDANGFFEFVNFVLYCSSLTY